MPKAPAPAPILFAPAVETPAGEEVGATGVFVAVVSKVVRAAVAEVEDPPPSAVVPEMNVDGGGVLTITVVEVTVLEELGRGTAEGTVETPATLVVMAPGTLVMALVGMTPGTIVEALVGMAPGTLVEALVGMTPGTLVKALVGMTPGTLVVPPEADGITVELTLGKGTLPEGTVGMTTEDVSTGQGTTVVYVLVVVMG